MNAIIKANGYNIVLGDKALVGLSQFLENAHYKVPIFILVDENTYSYCIPYLMKMVPEMEDAEIIKVMNGDEQKNIDVCMDIWNLFVNKGADEQSLLINLGGGMICEMGAFIASTFKGGIDFINIPTTLFSMTDSSVGSRASINFGDTGNHIYFSTNPQAVFVFPEFLDYLDKRQILSGFSVMLNYALIADEQFWQKLKKTEIDYYKSFSPNIYQAILIKNNIVMLTNKVKGVNNALYFGHRMGKAIEEFSKTHNTLPLLYGEALAIGMICESYISWAKGLLLKEQLQEITLFLKSLYSPYSFHAKHDKEILSLVGYDKKSSKNDNVFTLLRSIGSYNINQTADIELVKSAISYYRREFSNIAAMN